MLREAVRGIVADNLLTGGAPILRDPVSSEETGASSTLATRQPDLI
jgi:hypothetical protein